jgi:hypothetical protein
MFIRPRFNAGNHTVNNAVILQKILPEPLACYVTHYFFVVLLIVGTQHVTTIKLIRSW